MSTVIKKLKCHFARQGIPDVVISDNGPQFACEKFTTFASEWGFEHRPGSPGHQQTNGKAEAAVKEAKRPLRKAKDTRGDLYLAVLAQRNTPTESMGTSPAQRLRGRVCKTQLPTTKELLKPQSVQTETVKKKTQARQARQVMYYNKGARDLSLLEEGDVVRMRPFRHGQKVWQKATVTKRHDERSYEVESESGTYRRNRVDLTPAQTPAVTPNRDKEPSLAEPDRPRETPGAKQQPSEQQTTLAADSERRKRTIREPAYLKDYFR